MHGPSPAIHDGGIRPSSCRGKSRHREQPHLPVSSIHSDPVSPNGGFGLALSIVPSILRVIIVQSVATQNRKDGDGQETKRQQVPGGMGLPTLDSIADLHRFVLRLSEKLT